MPGSDPALAGREGVDLVMELQPIMDFLVASLVAGAGLGLVAACTRPAQGRG
jgi:hypothetical protein